MEGRRNIFSGFLLIFLGVLFLLINFGYLSWDIWLVYLEFWPLMLIALGLRLIFRHNPVVQVLVFLLIFILPLAYYFGFLPDRMLQYRYWSATERYHTYNWSQDKDGETTEGILKLDFGAGRIVLAGSDKLLDLNTRGEAEKPQVDLTEAGNRVDIAIKQSPLRNRLPRLKIDRWSEDWLLGLNRDIIWEMEIATGAIQGQFNLADVRFKRLDLATGAGNLRFNFGDTGITSDVNIDAGAGNITLIVPSQVGVKVRLAGGLGKNNFSGPTVWEKEKDTYTSSNYLEASTKINIDIEHGVGNFNIITENVQAF